MKVWIEALRADGSQILGNGDGQGPITAANYRRTTHYKTAKAGRISKRPASYQVVQDRSGLILETFPNPEYIPAAGTPVST